MKTITITLEDVPCKDCNQSFDRQTRSRLCPECKTKRAKMKKSIRNKKYYKMKKEKNMKT